MAAKKVTAWRCPSCGRRFARARQAHSCQVVPLGSHLAKASPATRVTWEAAIAAIRACGPCQVVPTKTGVNILVRSSLGGLSVHRDWVDLGFVLTRRVESPRVRYYLQISPRSHVHRVRLSAPADVDDEVKAWIREAYAVGQLAGKRPGPATPT